MADLGSSSALMMDDEDKKKQQEQGQASQSGGSAGYVSGNQTGNAPVSTAGVGAGGTGGWTNIQAYLGANKSDTGSAQALTNTVGSQFEQEKSKLTSDADKFKQDAEKQVKESSVDRTQADQYLQGAANAYKYGKVTQEQPYDDGVNKIKNALSAEYSGPREYTYGFQDQTQKYGAGLKDSGGFDQIMNQIYNKAAGGQLNRGQFALQKQLDVSNENLQNARKDLSNQYTNLNTLRDQTVSDTTGALSGLEQQFRTNQTDLADYLADQSNLYEKKVGDLEAQAKQGYSTDFNTQGVSSSALSNGYLDPIGKKGHVANVASVYGLDAGRALEGQMLSAAELEKEQRLLRETGWDEALRRGQLGYTNTGNIDRNMQALQNFYASSDKKYENTADAEKRYWNTIQDILGTGQSKDQGFRVRG